MALSPFVEKLVGIVEDQHARFHTHTETDSVLKSAGGHIIVEQKEAGFMDGVPVVG